MQLNSAELSSPFAGQLFWKKVLPTFCFSLSIFLFACNNSKLETVLNYDEDGNLMEKYTQEKETHLKQGLYTAYYSDGSLSEESRYENDTLNGKRKLYYESGQLQILENYNRGQFEGVYQAFYENGQLEQEGNYVANEMSGDWKRYFNTGELMEVVAFKNNEENGPFKEYYKSGQLKTEEAYLGGDFEQGLLKKFDENGVLVQKMQCEHGICRTIWTKEKGDIPLDKKYDELISKVKDLDMH